MKARSRGFTLVELLIVVGIIAVLVGILMPALSRSRDRANTIVCQNQLRQIALSVFNYAHENQSYLPPTNWPGKPFVPGMNLPEILRAYVPMQDQARTMWLCPTVGSGLTDQFPLTYGANQGVHPMPYYNGTGQLIIWRNTAGKEFKNPRRISEFRRPTELVSMGDGSLSSGALTTTGQLAYTDAHISEMNNWNQRNDPINKLGGWSWTNADNGNYHLRYRHNNNRLANVVFLDGHVETAMCATPARPELGLRNYNFATGY